MKQLKSRRGASDGWIVTSPVKPGSSFLTIRAIFGVQGWRWAWAKEVRELVFALDADAGSCTSTLRIIRSARASGKISPFHD